MQHAYTPGALAIGLLLSFSSSQAQVASTAGVTLRNHTPAVVQNAADMGPANPSEPADVTLWLQLHNRAALDDLAANVYNPQSPLYHAWLNESTFRQNFAPSDEEVATVKRYLSARGLNIVTQDPNNLYVRARGSVGSISTAFNVNLHTFSLNGQVFRANTNDPVISGETASLVRSISGLDNLTYVHHVIVQGAEVGGANGFQPFGAVSAADPASPADAFSACFSAGPITESYISSGTTGLFPGYPRATYTGLGYGSSTSPGCGYTPAQIQAAYHLNNLYARGLDGTGQTIVIIDWCGSPSIQDDANAFSAQFGLPPLTSSNFNIINYPTPSTCASADVEINLDVEWAHAIAPGASITLLVPPSASFQDTDVAQLYAVVQGLGSVISGSYGAEERLITPAELANQNLIAEVGAAFGVAANFSTGDSGDFTFNNPQIDPASVSMPAASPFNTAVGGVSLALNADSSIDFQTGWGHNQTLLTEEGTVYDPPFHLGFSQGTGGGASGVFDKPNYQAALAGIKRQLPDVSWLADPFTGAIILISNPFVFPAQQYEVIGGTSLSCPMFSALWAIANQEAGQNLGQAAPYLYSLPSNTLIDIVPYSSPNNVVGSAYASPTSFTFFSADSLAQPLNGTPYLSVIRDYPALAIANAHYVLTFGTDTSLTTAPGWDNMTGVGVPNGDAFADYFSAPSSNP